MSVAKSKANDTNYCLNTRTCRYVKKGSPSYNKLVVSGYFDETPKTEPIDGETKHVETPIEPNVDPEPDLKKEIKPILQEIVRENKSEFVGLTQKQTDELLKKMLYEKLCLNKQQPKSKKKEKKIKKKKSKGSQRYKVYTSSSSDSSSDSDSNSS